MISMCACACGRAIYHKITSVSREDAALWDSEYHRGMAVDKSVIRKVVYSWISDIDSTIDTELMEVRFWALTNRAYVEKTHEDFYAHPRSQCILWEGTANTHQGYPIFTIKGLAIGAHRVAARLGMRHPDLPVMWVVPPRAIPQRMTVDHCRDWGCPPEVLCVNPAHLDICTGGINSGRKRNLNVFT